jgi:hypothetical protein
MERRQAGLEDGDAREGSRVLVVLATGILDRPAGAELVHEAQEPSSHGWTSFVCASVRARCGARVVSGSRRDEQLLTEG